ncbi:hypothetical protein [Pedobacter steynii]|nr:hypothetical protein [Pedobacter steynii]
MARNKKPERYEGERREQIEWTIMIIIMIIIALALLSLPFIPGDPPKW